jgi:hypothetical protein
MIVIPSVDHRRLPRAPVAPAAAETVANHSNAAV